MQNPTNIFSKCFFKLKKRRELKQLWLRKAMASLRKLTRFRNDLVWKLWEAVASIQSNEVRKESNIEASGHSRSIKFM